MIDDIPFDVDGARQFCPEILALPIEIQERIAIMTEDGSMSDEEAARILGYNIR